MQNLNMRRIALADCIYDAIAKFLRLFQDQSLESRPYFLIRIPFTNPYQISLILIPPLCIRIEFVMI